MDKEAQEKIQTLEFNFGFLSDEEATEILEALRELGYRKLPQDKPPLLDEVDIRTALKKADKYWASTENEDANGLILRNLKEAQQDFIAQAQREADIKHYEH